MARYTIDPDHSVAAFSVRHLAIANIRGQFNKLSGVINFDRDNIFRSSVEAEIDAAGITTGVKKRDAHLLSPDFFDVEKYPKITFKSTKIEVTGDNQGKVTGDLTIHGITRSVTMDVKYSGPVKSPLGGEISLGFTATTSINREDFGMTWNVPLDNGGIMVDKDVQITIDIEADLTGGN
ncbi:MAG: polyisoprenoid-binding protein [Nitrospirae bacterium]|nr:MAG: polyisoprenoid-binding protein [Nitrospirota bacterium]